MKKTITAFFSFLFLTTSIQAQTPLPYYTGFDTPAEQANWSLFRKGSTISGAWIVFGQNFYSTPNSLQHNYPVSEPTDDWYVSPPFQLPAGGKIDSLRFAFTGFSPVPANNDTVAIYALSGSSDPALAIKTLLLDFRGQNYVNDGVWRDTGNINIPASSAASYLAFKYKGSSSWLDVRFDNLAISGAAPVSAFSISDTVFCEGETLQFTDASLGNPSTWSWSFPGGNPPSSGVSAPSVIYASAGVYTISLVSANASGSGNTAIKTITVNTCTGLSEKQHATGDIKFFPNPVKDKLRLQSVGEKPVMYQLYNSLGQLLYSGTLPGGLSVNISMEHLPKGIYLLNTTNAHGKEVHKIIKD